MDNESQRNSAFVAEHFPSLATSEVFYLEREDGGNILTPETFDQAYLIHNWVTSLRWRNTKDEGNPSAAKNVPYLPETQTLLDVCVNSQGGKGAQDVLDCKMNNPLELFGCALLNISTGVLRRCLLLCWWSALLHNGMK